MRNSNESKPVKKLVSVPSELLRKFELYKSEGLTVLSFNQFLIHTAHEKIKSDQSASR